MQYGQIVFLLFVAMVFYYAAMIFMDLQRAKAAQNAEQDSHKEEDIDISEEARSFRPIRINRDEPDSKEGNPQQDNAENPDSMVESSLSKYIPLYCIEPNSSWKSIFLASLNLNHVSFIPISSPRSPTGRNSCLNSYLYERTVYDHC